MGHWKKVQQFRQIVHGSVLRNFSAGKKQKVLCFSDFERKTFGLLAGLSKQHFTSPVERFHENLVFGDNDFLINFVHWPETHSASWQKKHLNGCQIAMDVSRETFWCFLGKNTIFYPVLTLSENVSDFWQKNFSRVEKNEFYVSRKTFQEFFLVKNHVSFYSCQTLTRKHSSFWQSFQQAYQNCA